MSLSPLSADDTALLREWRQDFHRHPEIAFEEHRTSALIAERLREMGLEVHTGLATTGVVATLHGSRGRGRHIGLRADIDALPIDEVNAFEHASQTPGRMHACGHDGHTTMLLGAARAPISGWATVTARRCTTPPTISMTR